jgi:hypothetical protein
MSRRVSHLESASVISKGCWSADGTSDWGGLGGQSWGRVQDAEEAGEYTFDLGDGWQHRRVVELETGDLATEDCIVPEQPGLNLWLGINP